MNVEMFDSNSCRSFEKARVPSVPPVGSTINVLTRPSGAIKSYVVDRVTFLYDEYNPDIDARVQVFVTELITH